MANEHGYWVMMGITLKKYCVCSNCRGTQVSYRDEDKRMHFVRFVPQMRYCPICGEKKIGVK